MRGTTLLLSACIAFALLAGCLAEPHQPTLREVAERDGDASDEDAEGDASEPSGGATTQPPASPAPEPPADPPDGPAEHHDEVAHGGTTLTLSLVSGPATLAVGETGTWTFGLENTGSQSVELVHGCGHEWDGPWIHDADGGRVPHQPPMAQCDGFSTVTMAPGETWTTETSWDGSLYDAEGEPAGQAAPGEYVVVLDAARTQEAWTFMLHLEVPFTLTSG